MLDKVSDEGILLCISCDPDEYNQSDTYSDDFCDQVRDEFVELIKVYNDLQLQSIEDLMFEDS